MRNGSTFKGEVDLGSASVGGQLSMSGSIFKGVNMGGLQVKSDLEMGDHATFGGDVNLNSASVGSQLDMSGSIFKGVNMGGLQVKSDLEMANSATFPSSVNSCSSAANWTCSDENCLPSTGPG